MKQEEVSAILQAKFPNAGIEVSSNDDQHFEIKILSPQFEGKNRIQQHQLVYNVLNQHINKNEIHAVSLTTKPIA